MLCTDAVLENRLQNYNNFLINKIYKISNLDPFLCNFVRLKTFDKNLFKIIKLELM